MNLEIAVNNSSTCSQFFNIFDNNVQVDVNTMWGTDNVSVDGYEGTVSTDFIARQLFLKFTNDKVSDDESTQLATLLETKVFIPLRDRIIQLDKYSCCSTLIYKIRNFTRIGWTPEDFNLTAGYPCLRHSMPLIALKKEL
ncbi:MAG: hypothetical protein K1060chlam1_00413 [Candidatus Anoxychlamydiales bacterium]|nr:hypothetical protein [Candidatus Anoxychlamydiales bacterium]